MLDQKTITLPELADLCHQYNWLSVHMYDKSGNKGVSVRFSTKTVVSIVRGERIPCFMVTGGLNSFVIEGDSFTMTIKEQHNADAYKFMSFTLQDDDFCCTMHLIA